MPETVSNVKRATKEKNEFAHAPAIAWQKPVAQGLREAVLPQPTEHNCRNACNRDAHGQKQAWIECREVFLTAETQAHRIIPWIPRCSTLLNPDAGMIKAMTAKHD
jgi:hypothetical protein